MVVKHLRQFYYYYSKYLNIVKCWEIRAASHNGWRLRGEGIPIIWLVKSKSLSFGPSHGRRSFKGECPPKCLHGNTFWEFWRQKFLPSTKSLGKTRMKTQTMIKRRNYGAKSFSSWLKIWGVWTTASRLVGHHMKWPLVWVHLNAQITVANHYWWKVLFLFQVVMLTSSLPHMHLLHFGDTCNFNVMDNKEF
jgi:hypothetical protein